MEGRILHPRIGQTSRFIFLFRYAVMHEFGLDTIVYFVFLFEYSTLVILFFSLFSLVIQMIPPRRWGCTMSFTMSFSPLCFSTLRDVCYTRSLPCWVVGPDFGVPQKVEACFGKKKTRRVAVIQCFVCFHPVDGSCLVSQVLLEMHHEVSQMRCCFIQVHLV